MSLPPHAYTQIAPQLKINRLLNGMWQVSGAHGPIEPRAAVEAMLAHHAAGFTTWDLADHYGPAEDFIGAFRERLAQQHGQAALQDVLAFTKWVPRPGPMTRQVVERAVDVSLRRMGVERLDMLQFHWWEYADKRYMEALGHLNDLRQAGKLLHLGLTNFDTAHLQEIVAAGIPIVSNQVQYSVVDRRPAALMAPFCAANGISLLTYGTFCGGLLAEKYLGQPEPLRPQLKTASMRKYKQMIDAWGGWRAFQGLLQALKAVADRRGVSLSNVGVRYILEQQAVGGVIAGVRLGQSEHLAENARVFSFDLTQEDHAEIEAAASQGRDLLAVIGDCGAEYRG